MILKSLLPNFMCSPIFLVMTKYVQFFGAIIWSIILPVSRDQQINLSYMRKIEAVLPI